MVSCQISHYQFTSQNGEKIEDLSLYKGQTVSAECSVVSRFQKELTADAITSVYNNNKLREVIVNKDITLMPNTKTDVSWSVQLPEADDIELKVLLWENLNLMKPLTTVRVISQQ